ncbi:MAG: PfkB family carbohydrate kinase [Planctomycetales bacterium]|nr:PfkB family carbohydrate kinase [Planctomycetales bacterium]
MSVVVVGSLAFDTVTTPKGKATDVLGGSATYFSVAASYFAPVRLVGVVGEDFPEAHRRVLADRRVDLEGLETKPGRTFRWEGAYSADMNSRETVSVELNAFGQFEPTIPSGYRDTPYVFLANASPRTQAKVLGQMARPRFVVADTMDLWIETQREDLTALLRKVDLLVVNDHELRQFTREGNLFRGAREVLGLGPRAVAVKKGEHGSLLVSRDGVSMLPAYPVESLVDPTGAGDAFAGGLLGYLAERGQTQYSDLRRGLAYGTVVASFAVQGFSLDGFKGVDRALIEERLDRFAAMIAF